MSENGNFKLILVTFCLVFCFAGEYGAAAFEGKDRRVGTASDSTKLTDSTGHLKKPKRLKSVSDRPRQSISEARELADFSILMEKALNSKPSPGRRNAYDSRY